MRPVRVTTRVRLAASRASTHVHVLVLVLVLVAAFEVGDVGEGFRQDGNSDSRFDSGNFHAFRLQRDQKGVCELVLL